MKLSMANWKRLMTLLPSLLIILVMTRKVETYFCIFYYNSPFGLKLGRGVFNIVPTWESAVSMSQQVSRKELPATVTSWGPQSAGPGSEAKLRKNEGKSFQNPTGNSRFITFLC